MKLVTLKIAGRIMQVREGKVLDTPHGGVELVSVTEHEAPDEIGGIVIRDAVGDVYKSLGTGDWEAMGTHVTYDVLDMCPPFTVLFDPRTEADCEVEDFSIAPESSCEPEEQKEEKGEEVSYFLTPEMNIVVAHPDGSRRLYSIHTYAHAVGEMFLSDATQCHLMDGCPPGAVLEMRADTKIFTRPGAGEQWRCNGARCSMSYVQEQVQSSQTPPFITKTTYK